MDAVCGFFGNNRDKGMTHEEWGQLFDVEGLFHEGEDVLATDCCAAFLYAKNEIKGRFRAGEKAMLSSKQYWDNYCHFLQLKGIII